MRFESAHLAPSFCYPLRREGLPSTLEQRAVYRDPIEMGCRTSVHLQSDRLRDQVAGVDWHRGKAIWLPGATTLSTQNTAGSISGVAGPRAGERFGSVPRRRAARGPTRERRR